MTEGTLINRVANSGLITLNLEEDFPEGTFYDFDLKDYLFQGLILREKEFRAALKEFDWTALKDKTVLVFSSADAIIPVWAYMLVSANAQDMAADVFLGNQEEYLNNYYRNLIKSRNYEEYTDQRIVIKGCSNKPVPASAYLELTKVLRPFAKSIMYGEPCSTVPIYKRK